MKNWIMQLAELCNIYPILIKEMDNKPGDIIDISKIAYIMLLIVFYVLTSIIRKILIVILLMITILNSFTYSSIANEYRQQKNKTL